MAGSICYHDAAGMIFTVSACHNVQEFQAALHLCKFDMHQVYLLFRNLYIHV